MKKQILSEEFQRMQKLAGIITEAVDKDEEFAYEFIDSESKKVKSLEEIPAFIAKLNQALFVDRNVETLYDTSVRYDIVSILRDNLSAILPEEIEDRLKDDSRAVIQAIENNNPSFFTEYEDDEEFEDVFDSRKKIDVTEKINQYIKNGSKGDLVLNYTKLTSLPDNLKVGGNLNLYATPITSLPNNLKVGGNLTAADTKITSLPDDLQVGGNLDLHDTPITSLPNNLKVRGNLNIAGTKITSLPNNLKVGGDLNCMKTELTSLPDDLQVGGNLFLFYTPLREKYWKEDIKKMYPGIKGKVDDI